MSTNDRNEKNTYDKDGRLAYLDSEGAPDGELSQDELNNVSGGALREKAGQQPDGRWGFSKTDGQTSNDPSERNLV